MYKVGLCNCGVLVARSPLEQKVESLNPIRRNQALLSVKAVHLNPLLHVFVTNQLSNDCFDRTASWVLYANGIK